jgi:hypothetical protein
MDMLSKNDLAVLLGKKSESHVSISIYMPTLKAGGDVRQNPIRLKNLLTGAEKLLVDHGLKQPEARKLLVPAAGLPENDSVWQHQSEGLAIFISPDVFQTYHVPINFKESVAVAGRFQIKPLLPMLSGDGSFYILALSQNRIRLLQCSRYTARELDLEGIVPLNLAGTVARHETQRQESHHMGGRGGGKEGMVFSGQNIGDEAKNNITRFFHQVNNGVHHRILPDDTAPLILAGVNYLHPIYKAVNTYPHMFDKGIDGNPEEISNEDLHKQAWQIMQPFFDKMHMEANAEYTRLAGSGHTSNDIKEIVSAAYKGSVKLLFVALDLQNWGTFDLNSNTTSLHSKSEPYDEDLLDFAAAYTIMHRGTVYAVQSENVPGGLSVAAVYKKESE